MTKHFGDANKIRMFKFIGSEQICIGANVLRAGVSSGLVTEIFQPTMKIQRNENDQLSEMPELRLPAVMCSIIGEVVVLNKVCFQYSVKRMCTFFCCDTKLKYS